MLLLLLLSLNLTGVAHELCRALKSSDWLTASTPHLYTVYLATYAIGDD